MGFVFVPVYISYLGIEAYGLIGLFATLQAWLSLLDLGLSPTLNREMARLRGGAHTAEPITSRTARHPGDQAPDRFQARRSIDHRT